MCYYFGKTKFAATARNRYTEEAEDAGKVQNEQENPDRKLEMKIASASLTIPNQQDRSAA
jgi:hypothetical protein